MAEYIYIAESSQYPGMVKIGRTDRTVDVRMEELSDGNYGLPGKEVDADWEAVKIIKVEDNEHAEAVLHEFYADSRVTDSRELFYTNDPVGLAYEAETISDGTILTTDLIEIGNLFEPLSLVALGAAFTLAARTFAPENKNTKKAEKFMREWEIRTERRYKNAKNDITRLIFGGLNSAFQFNKSIVNESAGLLSSILEELGFKQKNSNIKQNELQKTNTRELVKCKFGHRAVKRRNRYTGQYFWGCSKFPDCRWTKNI